MTESRDRGPTNHNTANGLRVGYLVNQYPKISHTFIRTEIAALETLGVAVERYSIRPAPERLVDLQDQQEAGRTRILLQSRRAAIAALLKATARLGALAAAIALTARTGRKSDRGLARHFAYLLEACILKEWARKHRVRHIHAHFGTNSAAVAMLCHELGGPTYSFTVHGPEEFDKAALIGLPAKIERAAFVVAVSDFGRSQLWRYTPADSWEKVHVVRCGIDDRFTRRSSVKIPDERRLVCVGRLCEQKGQLLLLRAASALRDAGVEFELTLVGDGEFRPVLESAIDEMQLRPGVSITGWQDPEQVRQHIEQSRAMVLPSFAEGLPVVIMEALVLHRPVISTYVAGIPELIAPGRNGWLVPAGALPPLIAAMREALEAEPRRLEEMGREGYEKVREHHDIHKNVRQLRKLMIGG